MKRKNAELNCVLGVDVKILQTRVEMVGVCDIKKRDYDQYFQIFIPLTLEPHLFTIQYSRIFLWNMTQNFLRMFDYRQL